MKRQAVETARRSWPRLPARLVANLLAGHSAIGLAFGALIYLICLTGTISVFVDELKLIEAPAPPTRALTPGALNTAMAEAIQRLGGPAKAGVVFISGPVTPRQRWTVMSGDQTWRMDAKGGLTPMRTPWTDFVTDLHMTLTLPSPWGSVAVGVIGAALLSLVLSGVLAHPRILRDAFVLRFGGNRRLQEADLHNRLSVWGLPFHIAVTLTGAFFGLSNLALMAVAMLGFHGDPARATRVLEGPTVAADSRAAPLPPLAPLVAQVLTQRPGAKLSYIGVEQPETQGAKITVEVTAPGRLPRGEQAYFDVRGHQIGWGRFASGPAGLQVYAGAAQVHFGFFGGLPVRIAYGVLGAALTYISATGITIWLLRRRDRGRPAPRLQRAWKDWTWGTPAALALASLTSAFAPVGVVFWGSSVLIMTIGQVWRFTPAGAKRHDSSGQGHAQL
jgi:uncharacterized iron-regulated membrane protein